MATTKKPTTTKKPAAKKTAVVKAHRGMAHVPRGRRRPLNPRQRPQVEPRRRGDDRPIRAPGIDRPQMPRGRNPQLPANFFQMSPNARKQFLAVRAARKATPFTSSVGRQTPAQLKAAKDRFNKMMEANKKMRANVFGRRRKPTQATQTPKVATPRRRPTGTPRVPQAQPTPRAPTPRRRSFRFRGRRT